MGNLKTKDAADLLSVSQTTIKRWVYAFPDFFQKDPFGHYIFSEQEIDQLFLIKDRINQGDTLDRITLSAIEHPPKHLQEDTPLFTHDPNIEGMKTRIEYVERSLDQKADEVVLVQVLQQREEIEELRKMYEQLAASLETIQTSSSKIHSSHDELHLAAIAKLQASPKKRGLLRSFFSFV